MSARRASRLVGDDAEFLALRGEAQHRLHEILAEGAVDPGGAQDRVVLGLRRHGLLAQELGRAIDSREAGRIVLAVGAVGVPSKT